MKIALLGYGKMGREVERIALRAGHEITLRVDVSNPGDCVPSKLSAADAAIEFSTPASAPANIQTCLEAGVPIVVGTTGWYDRFGELTALCREKGGAMFHATNFSIGVAIFFHLNKVLAGIMDRQETYDIRMEEIHHTQKLDAPSGTAITAAEGILGALSRKNGWVNRLVGPEEAGVLPPGGTVPGDKLLITSVRKDDIPGTHTVSYRSEIDSIELRHTAFGREGFARGAVAAAEWLKGRQGVFSMEDLLNF